MEDFSPVNKIGQKTFRRFFGISDPLDPLIKGPECPNKSPRIGLIGVSPCYLLHTVYRSRLEPIGAYGIDCAGEKAIKGTPRMPGRVTRTPITQYNLQTQFCKGDALSSRTVDECGKYGEYGRYWWKEIYQTYSDVYRKAKCKFK